MKRNPSFHRIQRRRAALLCKRPIFSFLDLGGESRPSHKLRITQGCLELPGLEKGIEPSKFYFDTLKLKITRETMPLLVLDDDSTIEGDALVMEEVNVLLGRPLRNPGCSAQKRRCNGSGTGLAFYGGNSNFHLTGRFAPLHTPDGHAAVTVRGSDICMATVGENAAGIPHWQ